MSLLGCAIKSDKTSATIAHQSASYRLVRKSLPDAEKPDPPLPENCLDGKNMRNESRAEPSLNTCGKDLFEYVRNNIIGKDLAFETPFGYRTIEYCDNTASGRSLEFIEAYIHECVLPTYANTHTTTSETAVQTATFREDARSIIHKSVHGSHDDEVIFVGSGCTGAIQKLLSVLNFKQPPIVFLSPYEHHSNLLPWKEIHAEIKWATVNDHGEINLLHLEEQLQSIEKSGRDLIGSFSAGSNITGILVDTDAVAAIFHRYGGMAFFDYASAGPYVNIDMNPGKESKYGRLAYKDAIFCSPHKFIGGPGTTGILVAKRSVFRNPVPSVPGGGTVLYVTETTHRYLHQIHDKEEGGTPAIVDSIRTGLVFQLKDALTSDRIMQRDDELVRRAHTRWKSCPNLILLGGTETSHKLPVFSFVIRHEQSGRLLHHNFVSRLLNDLFGIQCRGGCMCAGPYAEKLLGIDEPTLLRIASLLFAEDQLDELAPQKGKAEVLKPGFVRLNLPYYMSDDHIDMILEAVALLSDHGWKLLAEYEITPGTSIWKHRTFRPITHVLSLAAVSYDKGLMTHDDQNLTLSHKGASVQEVLDCARRVLRKTDWRTARVVGSDYTGARDRKPFLSTECEDLRWFLLPEEAIMYMNGVIPEACKDFEMPFFPGRTVKRPSEQTTRQQYQALKCQCRTSNERVVNPVRNPQHNNTSSGLLGARLALAHWAFH